MITIYELVKEECYKWIKALSESAWGNDLRFVNVIRYLQKCVDSNKEMRIIDVECAGLDCLAKVWNGSFIGCSDARIKQLKKQIKYSKNPLEIKQLNKELNGLYKERNNKLTKKL